MKRGLIGLAAAACAFAAAPLAHATPQPVKAFYIYATSEKGAHHAGYYDGERYAQTQPDETERVLMLDFGAARKLDTDTWGVLNFSGAYLSNADVLQGLEGAADGYHDGRSAGQVLIAYGNSNYHLSSHGMGTSNTWYAGYYQEMRAKQLADYEKQHVYSREYAAAGSDMEPSWEGPAITRQLVNGATAYNFGLYYNYGSADGCPWTGSGGGCNNGWDSTDAGYVSYHGMAWGLPEIYYTVNSDQWTVIRRAWEASHADNFMFAGVTAERGAGLSPQAAWNALATRNPGRVLDELICFGC
jgi:hypothetical protein